MQSHTSKHTSIDPPPQAVTVDAVLRQITELNHKLARETSRARPHSGVMSKSSGQARSAVTQSQGISPLLQLGFHPHIANELIRRVQSHDPISGQPSTLTRSQENSLNEYLDQQWRSCDPVSTNQPAVHVLVGPSGSGKSTALGKWLAQVVLNSNQSAVVWRLNGEGPNTAEQLSVLSEALEVPVERTWDPAKARALDSTVQFVDLPGVDWRNPRSIEPLARQLDSLPHAQVHLVLNLAYEAEHLFEQVQAFAPLPINDLILTHRDEERRPGKVWNLVLGTKHAIGYFSAGQNMPGDFTSVRREDILPLRFP